MLLFGYFDEKRLDNILIGPMTDECVSENTCVYD